MIVQLKEVCRANYSLLDKKKKDLQDRILANINKRVELVGSN